MDFSKKGLDKKQHYIKSTSRRLISKTRISFFRLLVAFIVFIVIVGSFAGIGFVKGLIDSAPDVSKLSVVPTGYTTAVYDKDGNVIENLVGAHSNRVFVKIDTIPKVVQNAFIAIEDERFYEHDGIDIRGIFRAFVHGISKGDFDQGASTITQQLLKNQVFGGVREKNFMDRLQRKVQEQYLSIQLENILDKKTILEDYLNTINLGSGTYGVQTASRRYFNKDVKELTLSEASVIAAIAQLPVYLNPITHPDRNAKRRAEILKNMLDQKLCTKAEYDAAVADDVYSRIQYNNEKTNTRSSYSYFVDELIEQVMNDLQTKLGYTQTQASNLLFSGGLSIYTTQDPTIQGICDDVYSNEAYFPQIGISSYYELTYALSIQKKDKSIIHYHNNDLLDYYKNYKDPKNLYVDDGSSKFSLLFIDKKDMRKKIDAFKKAKVDNGDTILGETITMTIQPQSSFVVMDQHNGNVAALIGGRGNKEGNRTLNRATNTLRQPGSTFKILSTYLPALDSTGMTLASVQDDSGPYYYPGTKKKVNNWTASNDYKGLTTLRDAITNSMNIVTVKTLAQVTPQVGYDYLLKLGFTSLVESRKESNGSVVSDIHLPMALGGLTDGVSNLELTGAYAAIANGGIYNKPIFYTKILDHNGKVLINNRPKQEQVMKESTAWLLTSAMEDVVNKGTGKLCKLTAVNMPVAGKTGSTSDYNDLWFSGFSPYYTASIWSGFDNNRTQTDRTYQKKIWKTIMEKIHLKQKLASKSFTMPDSIVTAKICTKSGKLAVDGLCDKYEGGDTTRIEYFAKGTEPTEKCDVHVKATICTKSHQLATDKCPLSTQKVVVLLNKKQTGKTADSPYVLPIKTCNYHKFASDPVAPTQIPTQYPGADLPDENVVPDTYQDDLLQNNNLEQ